jgi:hypothetical protein
VLQFVNSRFKPQAEAEPVKPAKPKSQYTYTPHQPKVPKGATEEAEVDEPAQPKIPRDKAEAWLAKHSRNAASLLAVFRALDDTNYLNEAATNFPTDPQVQLAVLSRNVYPEDRRKWLESFKASSPSNSLANYLSAADYFKDGKSDEAVRELLAASGKEQFQNYAMETLLNSEELFVESGKSPLETASYAMSGMAEENMPQLASFKVVAQNVGEARKQKISAGDVESAGNLAQLGLDFTGKINSGDSGKFAINLLVGASSEKIILSQLDQNTAYDFLGGQTPAQVSETLKQQKDELRKLMKDVSPAQLQMLKSDSETASYVQRLKIYGEIEAMKWLIQLHPPAVP